MVLLTLVDKENTQRVGSYHFPKKGPGNAEEYLLEEYLNESQFSYLKNETIKFIYGDHDVEEGATTKNTKESNAVKLIEILPKDGLLYVTQGEMCVTHPHDEVIRYIGSSDATTCHIVIIRDPLTGVAGAAHMDSVHYSHLDTFICKVRNLLENGQRNETKQDPKTKSEISPLDLYIVGGYQDERGTSGRLSMQLLQYFIEASEIFTIRVGAIGSLNTTSVTIDKEEGHNHSRPSSCKTSNYSHNAPVLYGAAIELATGRVFPAGFPYRGPDETLRHLCLSFCGRSNGFKDLYNHKTGELVIPAFCCNPHKENLKYYIQLPDDVFLQYMSTSPKVEPPHFIENQKKMFHTAIENPDLYKSVFPGRRNRVWEFHKNKGWMMKTEKGINSPAKIIDKKDLELYEQSNCDAEKASDSK